MSEAINQILDDLDAQMFNNFMAYATELSATWEGLASSANPGQQSIIQNHVLETVMEHIRLARKGWPYGANPQDYITVVHGCYDPEVMERAFGDTIEQTYSAIYEYWIEAMDWQNEHESMSSLPPHSTDANWRGNTF